MELNNKNMCSWELQKAGFLISEAGKLGMNVSGYGFVDVNPNSGYTYIWLEDYNFTLYMPINCELVKTDIYALFSCPVDGEEEEMQLEDNTRLVDLEKWAEKLDKKSRKKETVNQ